RVVAFLGVLAGHGRIAVEHLSAAVSDGAGRLAERGAGLGGAGGAALERPSAAIGEAARGLTELRARVRRAAAAGAIRVGRARFHFVRRVARPVARGLGAGICRRRAAEGGDRERTNNTGNVNRPHGGRTYTLYTTSTLIHLSMIS